MSQYGQFSNYGDGGFNTDGADGYNNASNSAGGFSNSQSGTQNVRLRQSITPVTLKQVADSTQLVPDGEYKFQHLGLNLVSVIGLLRRVNVLPTGVSITLEDGTGTMDIKIWVDDAASTGNTDAEIYQALENKYVYVVGTLRTFTQKKILQYTTVLEVTDHNQVLYHFLDAISVYSRGIAPAHASKSANPTSKSASSLFVNENADKDIFSVIKEFSANMQEGVPLQLLAQKMKMPVEEVSAQVQLLIESGDVYTGHDDTSYLAI